VFPFSWFTVAAVVDNRNAESVIEYTPTVDEGIRKE
jgi:hypothetical protein